MAGKARGTVREFSELEVGGGLCITPRVHRTEDCGSGDERWPGNPGDN